MNTESFIVHIKYEQCIFTKYIYKDIAEDVETRFDRFEIDRPLPKAKNEKVNGLMKDELGGQIVKAFVGIRAKHIAIKVIIMKIKNKRYKKVCHKKKT